MSSYRPLPVPAPYPAQAAGFGLEEFIAILRRRADLIVKVAAATVLAALLYAFSQPTIWSSSAVVMLDGRKNNIADATAVLSQLNTDTASIQNQIQILQSRALAEKVIAGLKLEDDPEFNGTLAAPGLSGMLDPRNWNTPAPADPGKAHDQVVESFLHHVSADANGLSTAITVSATARDPFKAQRIANALVNAYVQDQMEDRHTATAQTAGWLQNRAGELAAQLQARNEDVQRFKASHGLADAGPGMSLADQQMLGINNQIVQARSDLDQKLGVQQSLAGNDPANASQIIASPVITALRGQQAELARQEADLSTKYGPMHPKLLQLQAQRKDLDQKIAQEAGRIAQSVTGDVAAARSHLNALEASLQRAEQLSVNQNMARSQLQALEADAASTRTAYESFINRLRGATDQDAPLSPDSRILSSAALPEAPAAPKRALIVGASLPLGLMLGALLALLVEKFGYLLRPRHRRMPSRGRAARSLPARNPVGRTDWQKDWNGPPILGELHNAGSLKAADYVVDWPSSRFAHASAALARQLESSGQEGAVIALTAPGPGDAKSVVTVAIARAAARQGKRTIIIDCDPAHRTQAALHTDTKAGLYEVLTGMVALNDALTRDPRGSVHLLSLNQRPQQMAAMLASPQMLRLLDILRDSCDLVILDCGPALAGPEAALLARHADATLLVSRRDKLAGRSFAHAAEVLQQGSAAPVGLVLAS